MPSSFQGMFRLTTRLMPTHCLLMHHRATCDATLLSVRQDANNSLYSRTRNFLGDGDTTNLRPRLLRNQYCFYGVGAV